LKKSRAATPRPGENPKLSRRQVLTAAGLGLASLGGEGCLGPAPKDRCAAGPEQASPPEAETSRRLSAVDHLVVVVLENRSFDHGLGALALDADYAPRAALDGLTGQEVNVDATGRRVVTAALRGNGRFNPLHSWDASRAAWNGGRNDGFARVNADQGAERDEVMSHLTRDHLPFLFALAGESTVCDRWFSSFMGPTWPNRFLLHATTAQGRTFNLPMGVGGPATVWERMAERCWSAKNYFAGAIPWYSVAFPLKSFSGNDAMVPEPIDGFFRDAASGDLPSFSLIDPDYQLNDAHPPHDLALAEAFIASIHRALAAGPAWSRTMLVVTFDEHGGFYDHVPPPPAVDPDPTFRRMGFRVPAIVAGPMVRRGAVVSTPFEHVSIAATLRARFGIRSMGPRMDAAADLGACIDPEWVARSRAPLPASLPSVRLHETLARREALHRTSQPELERYARAGGVPRDHVDRRAPAERIRSWLRHAQELEAVRVVA
jgi:phospholipase C